MSPDHAYLEDILGASNQIAEYLAPYDKAGFLEDRKTQDAVIRQIEIMGEAATHISQEMKEGHPEVQWKELSHLRNFYIHAYRRINYMRVWNTCTNMVPQIRDAILKLLPKDE